ncbi:MAG: phosphoribosylanthranilate isomerase [Spirochaetes bacterium]|nr:phosphoribosylanthranilate isomerase [Spirochaetota bacterium]
MMHKKRTFIKICGITNPEDAGLALEHGADMLGFIFYEKSPRFVEPEKAGEIISVLKKNFSFKSAGVFVNPSFEFTDQVIKTAKLDMLQFHGDETPAFIQKFDKEKIKAFRIKYGLELKEMEKYNSADFYLLDTFSVSAYGGTGEAFNWKILADIAFRGKLFLSGGVNRDNVLEAINIVKPYAVDVCSSLESHPGKKDRKKLEDFFSVINGDNLSA